MIPVSRSLNVLDVMRLYFFLFRVHVFPALMVAWYTMSLLMHLFCSGHACVFLQLCGWLFLIMRVMWLVIVDLTLLMQL